MPGGVAGAQSTMTVPYADWSILMRNILLLLIVAWLLAICVADDPARVKHDAAEGHAYHSTLPHSLHPPQMPDMGKLNS